MFAQVVRAQYAGAARSEFPLPAGRTGPFFIGMGGDRLSTQAIPARLRSQGRGMRETSDAEFSRTSIPTEVSCWGRCRRAPSTGSKCLRS
jgi:hypothetical protein